MMIGVLSGTYSSIFIGTPVLIAWKQREPGYRARAARIEETMGYVPAFPEDNEVARVGDDGDGGEIGPIAGGPAAALEGDGPGPDGEPQGNRDAGAGLPGETPASRPKADAEPDLTPEEQAERERKEQVRERRRARRQERKRKHGRPR